MITIHATKKLHAKLPLNADGLLPNHPCPTTESVVTANQLSGWHANLLTLQRRNCVLMVHDATRFPLFIKALVKADFAHFNEYFADTLMNTLLKAGANQQQLDAAASLLAPCRFDTVCNRSVQGTLNHMAGDIEQLLWYDSARLEEISAYRTGAWLADRPCNVKGVKGYIWPQDAMLALLSQPVSQVESEAISRSSNVIQLSDYRGTPD